MKPFESFRQNSDPRSRENPRPTLQRRDFLKLGALATVGAAFVRTPVMAGPFTGADFEKLVPRDKKLDPAWVKSLFERGAPATYAWPESRLIGMPVGGICCGQLYLGGDGRLWHWDIFNKITGTGAEHYAKPLEPVPIVQQGFALRISRPGEAPESAETRTMDHQGWSSVKFTGEYPIGRIDYQDAKTPVRVQLEAFSPFIPLDVENSALPATFLTFTIRNDDTKLVRVELAGWLENAVCRHSAKVRAGMRTNRIAREQGFQWLECRAEETRPTERTEPRPDIVVDDFERPAYETWQSTGTAFGTGPVEADKMPEYQGKVGARGKRLVNSHATALGTDVGSKDAGTGTLTSKLFKLERDFLTFLIGGGPHAGRTCMNLLVGSETVLSATGRSDNRLSPMTWDLRRWAGQEARLQIVDQEKGAWGNIGIDHIMLTDRPGDAGASFAGLHDFGSMGLVLLDSAPGDVGRAGLEPGHLEGGIFSRPLASSVSANAPFPQTLCGALVRPLELAAGQSATVTFVLVWHFPNIQLQGLGEYGGREYGRRFKDAAALARYVAANARKLSESTRLWHQTWYERSTLPRWFLDRTIATASHLATNTCYWFGNGRFYAWEGVGCCAGTCTHVWHYAHAMGRLFPQLERSAREMVDYGIGFEASTGRIRFRAEHNNHWAVDGQAGCILRAYREHLVSADNSFLRRLYPRVKLSLEFLIHQDKEEDGIMDGPQHNTLDADWHGQVAWLSGLYLAALRAGEAMARELGDGDFAERCRRIFERGRRLVDERLFNGEYYYHIGDTAQRKSVGSYNGCEIDQVFGDSWSWQVGLGPILDPTKIRTALQSLWRYNFTPDVGPYRNAYKPGRWYAMAGEAGLLMCTWPQGEAQRVRESYDYYFNECMTGFEYQVAWHMVAEGMVQEGLTITRAIHDRYAPSRRNPWNEVECGDHYARAMASYGVYLAACGFHYDGPRAVMEFDPRLSPERFECAFTAAEGWGTFRQAREAGAHRARVKVRWGRLRLKELVLRPLNAGDTVRVRTRSTVAVDGQQTDPQPVPAKLTQDPGGKVRIILENPVLLEAGQSLELTVS